VLFSLAAALTLAACQTAPAGAPVSAAGDRELTGLARDLAAKLDAVTLAGAERLRPLELEMRRLSAALPDPASASSGADNRARPATAQAFDPSPAPELSGARSLMHAVRLGSYPNRSAAESTWVALAIAHGGTLGALSARIEDAPDGFVLKAGPFSSASEAQGACDMLIAAGARCGLSDFTGAPLS